MTRRLLLLAALLLASCARRDDRPAWAKVPDKGAPGEPTIAGEPVRVPKVAQKPTLDGKLDEPLWQGAAVLGPLVGPGGGEKASAKSPVAGFARLAWDDANLYVGAVVGDGAPVSPFQAGDVDPRIWEQSSAIELMIQPGDPGDNKGYYEIQVDVASAVFDTAWDDYNKPITGGAPSQRFGHMEWSSKAERAVHVEPGKFYSIEAVIPWSAFTGARVAAPPKPGDVWRLNVYSFRDGQRQALAWSPIRQQGNFHKSSRFGRVRFE
ncbi:MAG: carbohydrate-binding family 9-like protein [Deltaproteobacteria bacterium]|nr:carbohydrate-binding family 9-like protein [Deltaproteobacteria bacterium]